MPAVGTAEPLPAVNVFVTPRMASITTPEIPPGTEIRGKEVTVTTVPVTMPTFWRVVFSIYAYFLPLVLFATRFALAAWDIVRLQHDTGRGATIA